MTDYPDDMAYRWKAAWENRRMAKRSRGRPVEKTMPDPVPISPDDLAQAIMQGPPKKKWRYVEKADG